MAEEQDEQQRQQNILDLKLVPINEKVKNAISNFRIALEKTQPDVIYKDCSGKDSARYAPEIYMQQFWHIVAYDLTAKAHLFMIDTQVFKVNTDLLHNALRIIPKDLDHSFTILAPEKEIICIL
nr:hypothetical protein [Tanacetum cinerariifolium]